MKRITIVSLLMIIVLIFVINCLGESGPPPSYPYDPAKAGVEVLLNKEIRLDAPRTASIPSISKYEEFVYIYDGKAVSVFDENLKLKNKIAIDPVVDLSIDMNIYEYRVYSMIIHNDKIVTGNYFIINDDKDTTLDSAVRCLQMDLNGNNKRLITFEEANTSHIINYNSATKKIMIGKEKIAEYTYGSIEKEYVFDNTYDVNMSYGKNKFNDGIVWKIPPAYAPYGIDYLIKYNYKYSGNKIDLSSKLKDIALDYLHIQLVSDLAIDGEYLWLISWGSAPIHKVMKVRPL